MANLARVFAGVIAVVLLVSTSGVAASRLDGSRPELTQAAVLHALPVLHAPAIQHRDCESRSSRRAWPHMDLPLAARANQSTGLASRPAALAVAHARPVADVVARGYDATAPPVA
jgi:hypothetical protein